MRVVIRGVSLIEIMVGVTVLSLAMTLMVSLIPSTASSLSLAEVRTQAGALAQSELEALSLRDLASLADGPLPPTRLENGTELRPSLKVTPAGHGALRVRVTVEWNTREVVREQFREKVLFPLER